MLQFFKFSWELLSGYKSFKANLMQNSKKIVAPLLEIICSKRSKFPTNRKNRPQNSKKQNRSVPVLTWADARDGMCDAGKGELLRQGVCGPGERIKVACRRSGTLTESVKMARCEQRGGRQWLRPTAPGACTFERGWGSVDVCAARSAEGAYGRCGAAAPSVAAPRRPAACARDHRHLRAVGRRPPSAPIAALGGGARAAYRRDALDHRLCRGWWARDNPRRRRPPFIESRDCPCSIFIATRARRQKRFSLLLLWRLCCRRECPYWLPPPSSHGLGRRI